MQFRNTPLVAIVILALLTPLVCSGASYAYIDDAKLWRESDTIVNGTVTSITSEESGSRVYHYVEVEVERYLKNPSEASSIVIHYYTRTIREIVTPEGMTGVEDISDIAPEFKVGEKVYVFLRRLTPDYYEVYGGFQGKYSIVDGLGVGSGGRRISIPAPFSPIVMIEVGIVAAVFVTIWIKRDWLFERIVGMRNG
jgi:hypothetical protein